MSCSVMSIHNYNIPVLWHNLQFALWHNWHHKRYIVGLFPICSLNSGSLGQASICQNQNISTSDGQKILGYITFHLADAFNKRDWQWIRLSRRHTRGSNVGLRASLKGPTAVQILSWPQQRSNPRPCGSKSSSLIATLQAALWWGKKVTKNITI